MAKKPDELLQLVKPWGIEKETEKFTLMSADFVKKNGQLLVNSRLGGKMTWNIPKNKIGMKPKDYQITKEDLLTGF